MPVKVSICVPAYQEPECLRRALESISIQTWTDYEVVISDDSSDECVENVVDEFRNTLPIHYQHNSPAKGSPENWNTAIGLACGDYIKIVHHDDWFMSERSLEAFVELIESNPSASFAFSASANCYSNRASDWIHRPTSRELDALGRDPTILFCRNFIGAPSATIFRASAKAEFDVGLKWVVDIDFYISLLSKVGVFGYLDEPLVGIRNDAPSRVTADCLRDSALQLREYTYLYRKLAEKHRFGLRRFVYLSSLYCTHGMRSVGELSVCGVPMPAAFDLRAAVACARIGRGWRMARGRLGRVTQRRKDNSTASG